MAPNAADMSVTVSTGLLAPSAESQESQVAGDEPEVAPLIAARPARIAALLAVPLLWGSFTPVLKVLLKNKNHPPALLTNLLSHTIGAFMLSNLWLLQSITQNSCPAAEPKARPRSLRASAELGLYLFFGQLTQLLGLKNTSATTNAILVQASVIVVPLLDRSDGGLRWGTWARVARRLIPSTLALFGVVLLTLGPDASLAASVAEEDWRGIMFSLISAACYALHTVRLSAYGDVEPTAQAAGQVLFNALLDLCAMPFSAESRQWLGTAGHGPTRHLLMAASWNGVVVVGATTWAMSYAQQAFSASTAALAYAMEPVCAALIAIVALGDVLAPLQMLGGGLVILANIAAARSNS